MTKIYTKSGDQGQSSLIGGQRVNKNHFRLIAYGDIDELNSQLGLLICNVNSISQLISLSTPFTQIQNELFIIGSLLACENESWLSKLPQIHENSILALENQIDIMDQQLPPLKNFILPQGHFASVQSHICRTICRRAERNIFSILDNLTKSETTCLEFIQSTQLVIKYINRLSDYFFTIARFINHQTNSTEVVWSSKS